MGELKRLEDIDFTSYRVTRYGEGGEVLSTRRVKKGVVVEDTNPAPRKRVLTPQAFEEIVFYINEHSDFFDPATLGASDYEPLDERSIGELAHFLSAGTPGVEPSVGAKKDFIEVLKFLQEYSDVNLTAPDDVPLDNLVTDWYLMYIDYTEPD